MYLIDRGRLESLEASDLTALADAQIHRATLRLTATAISALEKGDVDGAYAAAYDAYRMAAEALLGRQGLRATGGDGSHMSVEDAVSGQFAAEIAAITKPDAEWAIEKAAAALEGARTLLSAMPPERFS